MNLLHDEPDTHGPATPLNIAASMMFFLLRSNHLQTPVTSVSINVFQFPRRTNFAVHAHSCDLIQKSVRHRSDIYDLSIKYVVLLMRIRFSIESLASHDVPPICTSVVLHGGLRTRVHFLDTVVLPLPTWQDIRALHFVQPTDNAGNSSVCSGDRALVKY